MFICRSLVGAHRCQRCCIYSSLRNNNVRFCSAASYGAHKVKQLIATDLHTAEQIWQQSSDSRHMTKFLFDRFSEEKNCYTYVLNLVASSPKEDITKRQHLTFEIMSIFNQWVEQNTTHEELTSELKKKALETVLHKKDSFLVQLVCNVFQIQNDKEIVKDVIEKLVSEEKFYEASQCVLANSLQNVYPKEKIILPLIFAKHTSFAIRYMNGNLDLQIEVAKYLDNLLMQLQANPDMRFQGKLIDSRFVFKCLGIMIKQYSLPQELFQNWRKAKLSSSINLLVRKKMEQSINEKAWEDIAMTTVQDNQNLQRQLVQNLVIHNEAETAVRLAKKFNWSQNEWPSAETAAKSTDDNCYKSSSTNETDGSDNSDQDQNKGYLTLDLDAVKIVSITTKEDFYNCLQDICKEGAIVGLDSEWRPFQMKSKIRLSLIQLAIGQTIYMLDMLSLASHLFVEDWDYFMENFFANSNVLKLGCGVAQDIQMIIDEQKGTQSKPLKFSKILDMSILYQKMQHLYETVENTENYGSLRGLSRLSDMVLGKPIDKSERACDWEERPLSETQILYAALDAHCLLQLFNTMKALAIEKSESFEHFVNSSIYTTTGMSKTAVKVSNEMRWVRSDQSFCYRFIKDVRNFKVVLDSELSELCLKLRMYGIDVSIQDAADIYKDSFKELNQDDRVLVASAAFSEKVKGVLPYEKYYIIQKPAFDSQNTVALIFQHFNLQVNTKSIFSRCLECNNPDLQEMSSENLHKIWTAQASKSNEDSMRDENVQSSLQIDNEDNSDSVVSNFNDSGIRIQTEKLNTSLFSLVDTFKICSKCGNVQWQR